MKNETQQIPIIKPQFDGDKMKPGSPVGWVEDSGSESLHLGENETQQHMERGSCNDKCNTGAHGHEEERISLR